MRETNPPLNLYLNDHFLRVARFHNGRQGKNKDWIFVLLMNRRKYEKSENIGFSSFCNSAAQLQACHERVVTVEGGAVNIQTVRKARRVREVRRGNMTEYSTHHSVVPDCGLKL